jgi:glucosamine-6-phosphate deaminase
MKWQTAKNYEDMSKIATTRMFNIISHKLSNGNIANIGMATGNTMLRLYDKLAKKLNESKLNLSGLSTYNLDEYVGNDGNSISPDDPLSYRKYMNENFFKLLSPSLGFKEENMHFPDALNPEQYDCDIEKTGGLDFQLLGLGFNGHIAFNEPITSNRISVNDFAKLASRIISLDELTIQTNACLTANNNLGAVPKKAVTMGMKSILNAKEVMLLTCFEEQTAPLLKLKTGEINTETPASFLQKHSNTTIIYTANNITL